VTFLLPLFARSNAVDDMRMTRNIDNRANGYFCCGQKEATGFVGLGKLDYGSMRVRLKMRINGVRAALNHVRRFAFFRRLELGNQRCAGLSAAAAAAAGAAVRHRSTRGFHTTKLQMMTLTRRSALMLAAADAGSCAPLARH
jgi:hypothetical protein